MDTTLAERIKTIIKNQNMKQAEFAKALGVSANYISLIVTGRKQNVSLTFAKLIESLYGYPSEWVLHGKLQDSEESIRMKLVNVISKMSEEELQKLEQFIKLL